MERSGGKLVRVEDRHETMRKTRLDPDAVIESYKKHIDRTLLRQNLQRSIQERLANLLALQRLAQEARRTGGRSGSTR